MKPIKVIRTDGITLWNSNDGTETYSRDIVALLEYLNIDFVLDEVKEK